MVALRRSLTIVSLAAALGITLGSPTAAQRCRAETQVLVPPSAAQGIWFGSAVARRGNVAVVAAIHDDPRGPESGSIHVLERHLLNSWQVAQKRSASDGAPLDLFGTALAVHGDTVLVGAPGHNQNGGGSGAVYVFARDQGGPGQWGEVAHFAPPSAGFGARFGEALAVHGDLLLVGAPHYGTPAGAAYLYRRDASSPGGWTLALARIIHEK